MAAPLLPHPAATAGGALVVYGELHELARRHQITLVSFAGASPADREGVKTLTDLGVSVLSIWREPDRGLAAHRRRARLAAAWLTSSDPLRALKFHDLRVQAALDQAALGCNFDLIHVEDSSMGQYRYPRGISSVLTEQDVRAADQQGHSLEAARWRRYQQRVWRRFDRLQVFTEHDADGIRQLAPDLAPRVRVNPFGIAVGPAADPKVEREDELVFVGGFHHPPNVDAACWLAREILPLVRVRRNRVHLTIVGANPPPAVRRLAADEVAVTGYVPDVAPFLDRAAVVVVPLRTGRGMRVKVLEALARGKAVVATSLGAEGLAQGAPIRIAESAPDIARAVEALLADRKTRVTLGGEAREFVAQHHTWESFGARLASTYRELGLDA